jgi:protein subunit release factor A
MARRFDEIEAELANPAGGFDQERYTALIRERAQLEAPVQTHRQISKLRAAINANEELARLEAGELRDLALEENRALIERTAALEESWRR